MHFKPSFLALKNKPFTYLLLIMAVVYGLISFRSLPKEWTPDVQIPVLYLTVPFPGSSATDVENLITFKLEKELKGMNQLKKITSFSNSGVATIKLEFELGFDISEAKNQVRSAWDNVKGSMPEDVENIKITEINFSEQPIMSITMSGSASLFELKKVAEEMKDDIETIAGTLESELTGGLEREIQINVDPYLLDYYQIDLQTVSSSVTSNNRNIPAGSMNVDTSKFQIRVPGAIDKVSDIEDFVIASRNGSPVYVRNVAEVRDSFKDIKSVSRTGNDNAVTLQIKKKAGENLIRISDEAEEIVEEYREKYPAIEFTLYNKASDIVKTNLSQLLNNILLSFGLVFLTLLFFMGFRSAIIVGTAIPISMLMSYIVLRMLGVSLNMVVLFALVLALGMLVDNGIVVVENMYRHLSSGKSRFQACLDGVSEVAWPIISSTVTTLAAFFPLLFMPGIMGDFLKYLPITLISTLVSSLFVALIFAVVVGSNLMKAPRKTRNLDSVLSEEELANRGWFLRTYGKILSTTVWLRYLVLPSVVALWFGAAMFYGSQGLGVIFFPETEPTSISVKVETPPGTNFFHVNRVMGYFEELVNEYEEFAEIVVSSVGISGESGSGANKGEVFFQFPVDWKTQKVKPSKTVVDLRESLAQSPPEYGGVEWEIIKAQGGPPQGKPVNIEIRGENLNVLKELSQQVERKISDLKGLVNLKDDLTLSHSEMELIIDRQKLAAYNLGYLDVANALRMAVYGQKASTYQVGEDEYDIYVRIKKEFRQNPEDLLDLRLLTRNGAVVTLGQVAGLKIKSSTDSVKHIALSRVVTISGDAEGVPEVTLLNQVKERLADFEMPPGYRLLYTGGNEDQKESQEFLIEAFVIAVFLIFLVLVAQFKSFALPVIILFSVVMSFIGIFVGNTIHQMPFSIIMGGIGAVSLAGVVVNNSIVLIDYAQQLKAKGYPSRKAITVAGQLRLRPVFLTAFTSIVSLFPIIYKTDIDFFRAKFSLFPFNLDLSEIIYFGSPTGGIWLPLAYISAYGLGFATFLTLFLIPTLYCIYDDFQKLAARIGACFAAIPRAAAAAFGRNVKPNP